MSVLAQMIRPTDQRYEWESERILNQYKYCVISSILPLSGSQLVKGDQTESGFN